ncbi:MAG: hypothetical protein KDC26_07080 [Armatimonadetes bacterium]|nr:hypothetical protein [Armatimonadota bacterium]
MFVSTAIAASLIFTPQNTNPFYKDQTIEDLVISAPGELKKTVERDNYRGYQFDVKDTAGNVTETFSVVVTDYKKVNPTLTDDQLVNIHDNAVRRREGTAAQLFLTQKTKLNNRVMGLITGSMMVRASNGKTVNAYHISVACSTEEKAYEITYLSLKGGKIYTDAFLALRNVRFKLGTVEAKPSNLLGNAGDYFLLGFPFFFQLPQVTTIDTGINPKGGEAGRYLSSVNVGEGYVTVELVSLKEDAKAADPKALVTTMGYGDWLTEDTPAPKLTNGVYFYDNLKVAGTERVARIWIGASGKNVAAMVQSADSTEKLPDITKVYMKK